MAYTPSQGLFNPNKSYSSMTPGGFNNLGSTPGMINKPAPNATSVATKQPVYIPPTIPSPSSSSTAPIKKTVTTTAQGDTHEVHYDNTNQPGGTNALGTHIMTQEELEAQNAKNGTSQQNSGALVVGGTPQPPTPTQVPTPASVTYPGLINRLADTATTPNPLLTENLKKQQELASEYGPALATVTNTPGLLANQNARASNLTSAYGAEMQGLGTNIGALTNLQGTQQSGLNQAAGLAAPQQVGYNVQYTDPMTGQPYSGESSQTLKDAVSGVVEKLKAGTMGYNDALTALQGYGQGGINALQNSLPAGFNIAQSNTLAGQQGSIGVNYQLADTALTNVENIQKQLGALQTTNQPIVNSVANWISTQFGIGSKETRAMTGAVASLRNAYASLLASAKGGTPTDYSGQAQAEIPNEPTPNDIAAIRQNFETLGKARANILGNPGQSNNTSNGGTMFGSFFGANQ